MIAEGSLAVLALALLATWLLHGTLLLGAVALFVRLRKTLSPSVEEGLWKSALLASFVSALLASEFSTAPRLVLDAPAGSTAGLDGAAEGLVPAMPRLRAPASHKPSPDLALARHAPATARPAVERRPSLAATDAALLDARDVTLVSATTPAIETATESTTAEASFTLADGLLLAWGVLTAVGLALLGRRHLRLKRGLGQRQDVSDERALGLLRRLRPSRAVRLTSSAALAGPVALSGQEICLPPRALRDLDDQSLSAMLAHELAHLERRDPQWRVGMDAAVMLLPVQPLLRLARTRLAATSELLCDDWAVRATGRPRAFARCLAEVASWITSTPRALPVAAMARPDSDLVSRVRRLASGRRERPLSAVAALALTAGLLLPALLAAPVVAAQDGDGLLDRVLGAVRGLNLPATVEPASLTLDGALITADQIEVGDGWLRFDGPVSVRFDGGTMTRLELDGARLGLDAVAGGYVIQAGGLEVFADELELTQDGDASRVAMHLGSSASLLAEHLRAEFDGSSRRVRAPRPDRPARDEPHAHPWDAPEAPHMSEPPAMPSGPAMPEPPAMPEAPHFPELSFDGHEGGPWEGDFEDFDDAAWEAWDAEFEAWEDAYDADWDAWEAEFDAWEQSFDDEEWDQWESDWDAWELEWEAWEDEYEVEMDAWADEFEADMEAWEADWESEWGDDWEGDWDDDWEHEFDAEMEAWEHEFESDMDAWESEFEAEMEAWDAEMQAWDAEMEAWDAEWGDWDEDFDEWGEDLDFPELEELQVEYEQAMRELEQELSFMDREFEMAFAELEQEFDMASQDWQHELNASLAEIDEELSAAWDEIWSDELEREMRDLEDEWEHALQELEDEYEQMLDGYEGDDEALEEWLEVWEQRYEDLEVEAEDAMEQAHWDAESRWEERETLAGLAAERLEREIDRNENRFEREFDRTADRLDRDHEREFLLFERRIEDLDRWYEQEYEAVLGESGYRDCDHGCATACARGCTHPDDENEPECEPEPECESEPACESEPDCEPEDAEPTDAEIVQVGDTLPAIAARRLGSADLWPELARLNGLVDGSRLAPGQVLRLR
jgi:beta-lactamase regulating signal transducer with metallopeptidase domain